MENLGDVGELFENEYLRGLFENGINVDDDHRFDYALQQGEENPIRFVNETELVDYSYYYFSFHAVSTVVFPEQSQPLVFRPDEMEAYEKFISAANSNYFIVLFPKNIVDCRTPPFVATVCRVVRTNPETRGVEIQGVHRCRVVERNNETWEVRAQVLPEVELPSILPKVLPRYANNLSMYEKNALATRISGYPFDSLGNITERNVEKVAVALKNMLGEEMVEVILPLGLTYFSYFVAAQMLTDQETEYRILKENSADARIDAAAKYFELVEAVCKHCRLHLYQIEHILQVGDLNLTHVNEHGFVHQISLLSEVSNFEEHTMPSSEYTWFPGYSWIILGCTRCSEHIGWKYVSDTQLPRVFYGIKREAVTFLYRKNDESADEGRSSDSDRARVISSVSVNIPV